MPRTFSVSVGEGREIVIDAQSKEPLWSTGVELVCCQSLGYDCEI